MPFEAPLFSEVAASLAAYFDGLHQSDSARLAECWHPDARLYGLSPDGAELLERDAPTFFAGVDARAPSPDLAAHDRIISIDSLRRNCAAAKVQVALPSASGDVLFTDFLVLLHLEGRWLVISKVYSSVPLAQQWYLEPPADPTHSNETNPVSGVGMYIVGGHQSKPDVMAENFHPSARLCFADEGEQLVIWNRDEFFERAGARPATHEDAHAKQFDKIISVDKAGPDCALIKLMIGYPPAVYVDFLSMLRIGGTWWIVAKSSEHEAFPS
jgi:hypothetical protein